MSTSEKSLAVPDRELPTVDSLPTLSLRKNFAWTLLGNLIYAASQWAILVVLSKCGSPELVGRYALALATIGPILTLASLQLRSIQATDARDEHGFADYLALRLFMVLVAMGAIAGLAMWGGYRQEVAWVILAFGVARGIESIGEIFLGLFQRHERMDLVSRSVILKGTFTAVGFIAVYFLTGSLTWAVAGVSVAGLLMLVAFDLRWARALTSVGSLASSLSHPRRLARLGWLALPLAIGTALASLEVSIPRYFIERQLGERELGIFAAMAYLTAVPVQAINALGQSASPKLARLHASGERRKFLGLLTKLVGAGLGIGTIGILVTLTMGQTILTFVYTPEYGLRSEVLIWLMAAAGITYGYIFLGTALNALRVFRPRVPIHLLTLGLLFPTCVYFGGRWGLAGVAWAICASQAVAALCYLAVVSYCLRKPLKVTS